jgi:hypothetical protein
LRFQSRLGNLWALVGRKEFYHVSRMNIREFEDFFLRENSAKMSDEKRS